MPRSPPTSSRFVGAARPWRAERPGAPLGARAREGLPKYLRLAEILRDRILRQEYELDEQIPTEERLCEHYEVSRITVREAVNLLVRDGLLERRQGRGTYVVAQKLRRNIAKVYSFSHDMVHLGLEPSSVVLEQVIEQAPLEVAALLKLPHPERRVVRIHRVRKANDAPILLERTLIPAYLCPGLERADLVRGSLYELLTQRYRLFPHTAEETYEAILLPPADARLLGCTLRRPHPAFAIQRITFLEDGTPIEFTRGVGRGDRLTLGINMAADQADFQRLVGVPRRKSAGEA